MSALTDKIAAEHVAMLGHDGEFTCGCHPGDNKVPFDVPHIAEVTETAVREQIARDIEAHLPPSIITFGPATYVAGKRDGLHDAARLSRTGVA